ncbi:ribosome maturation factor RimP [Microscilla marina]|uniref:Ribosome maturation factor RimP n=1 Tax=Microscilla marina ATCC 23134 TaxID=313606 RepID=A1ZEG3_MICM2|nr:ribosome maturation factor RimP [Microscilla marina]EAY31471.1 15 kDa protein [Microscilla marina ATCC 23134]
MNQEEKLTTLIKEHLEPEYFLIDVILKNQKPKAKLTVLIDGDQGVSIDRCATLSRWLGKYIEEENLIEGAYTLEVSSPGVDLPLKNQRQYIKNIGRKVKVSLNEGGNKTGVLEKVEDKLIVIQPEKKGKIIPEKEEIPFDQIMKTKVMISFG